MDGTKEESSDDSEVAGYLELEEFFDVRENISSPHHTTED